MSTPHPGQHRRRGPVGAFLGLFSSITLGIVLLSVLFVYCSVGSAGILYPTSPNVFDGDSWTHAQLRQWRPFEMTEFEWFHWWPFDLLIGLICLTLVVATLRRIPLRVLNLGVWMIHTGIIVLAAGSTWYFATKVEGDAPVVRRAVTIELPGSERTSLPAVPGARTSLMGEDGLWEFLVQGVDPEWAIRSGRDEGKSVFSVTVSVRGPGRAFMRQMLAGHPEYTEDIVPGGDPGQPMARAVKTLGRALVDDTLLMGLDHEPQQWVYLANWVQKSWALYLRETGTERWYQRPVEGLPLYNDYVGSYEDVWTTAAATPPLDPLDVRVPPAEPGDPLPDTELRIGSYLRYAVMETRNVPGGEDLEPAASVRVRGPGGPPQSFELLALDARRREAADGALRLEWIGSAEERDLLLEQADPLLTLVVPGAGGPVEQRLTPDLRTLPEDRFTSIEGSDYAYHVNFWADQLVVDGRSVSMASVTVRAPGRAYERWVFEDGALTHDRALDDGAHVHDEDVEEGEEHDHAAHGAERLPLDEGIGMSYRPGRRPAPFTLVAGPGERDLSLLVAGVPEPLPLEVGQVVPLGDGTDLTVTAFAARSVRETRPAIVPPEQRDRDVREGRAMVRLTAPGLAGAGPAWVHFHTYPLRDVASNLRRYRYMPTTLRLPDGRSIEVILSRQRLPLPTRVVLEDFEVASEVGGFTGRTSSIRNWTSLVRFEEPGGGWSEPLPVSVNQPIEHGGYWYFQSQWDPPSGPRFAGDPPSAGLNYTVLGVGNRHGVGVQLAGCSIAVMGMLYAFYVKPVLRRRRAEKVAVAASAPPRPRPTLAPVGTVPGERT